MGRTKADSGKAAGSGIPTKKLKKVTKNKTKDVSARMIIEALNRMDEALKGDDVGNGHSLAKIRNYIRKNHGLVMSKYRQELIKDIMEREFDQGRIEMTNSDDALNFTKRFQSLVEDSEVPDEDMSETEAEE